MEKIVMAKFRLMFFIDTDKVATTFKSWLDR